MKDIEALSALMDSRFKIFGVRIGLDGIIGLIPVVGDVATSAISIYIVFRALSMGFPFVVILQMLFNVLIDFVVGAVPFLGNIFDFFWRANEKNINLIKQYHGAPLQTKKRSNLLLLSFVSIVLLFFGTIGYLVFKLIGLFFGIFI